MRTSKAIILHAGARYSHLVLLAIFCVALLLLRVKLTQSLFFLFLIWNLFLAWLPLAITTLMLRHDLPVRKNILFYPCAICWLLLLPNAPYIITDFINLGKERGVPQWFDVLMIASFATTGLLCGLASLKEMHKIVGGKLNTTISNTFIVIACFLSGFGIYLGRVLRYNSWDVVHRPFSLAGDILWSLIAADTYRTAWGMTLGFGILMLLLHLVNRGDINKENL